jgi:hypothetical protein
LHFLTTFLTFFDFFWFFLTFFDFFWLFSSFDPNFSPKLIISEAPPLQKKHFPIGAPTPNKYFLF